MHESGVDRIRCGRIDDATHMGMESVRSDHDIAAAGDGAIAEHELSAFVDASEPLASDNTYTLLLRDVAERGDKSGRAVQVRLGVSKQSDPLRGTWPRSLPLPLHTFSRETRNPCATTVSRQWIERSARKPFVAIVKKAPASSPGPSQAS